MNGDGSALRASVSGLAVGYDGRPVLREVSLRLAAGELVALVGPNGAGKSTLLKVLAGLLAPWRGEVRVLGSPPGRQPLRVAYLPQAEAVDWSFPVSVWDVVLMGRYARAGWLRRPGPTDRVAARQALDRVGLGALADRQVGRLSGGQQRRAFLARALAQDAELYLLDEPVTGVDAATEEELMRELEVERQQGKAIVVSTHDLAGVAEHFTRVICLNETIVADGPASLVRDGQVLRRTFGGHLLEVQGQPVLLDRAQHEAASGTRRRA